METQKRIDIAARRRPTVSAGLALVLMSVVGLWAGSLAASRIVPEPGMAQSAVMSGLYYVPFIVCPIAVYAMRRRGIGEGMRLNPVPAPSVPAVVALALLCVLAASELVYLWSALLDAAGLSQPETALAVGDRRSLAMSILLDAALPAVCEELLFRGFVMSAWEGRGTRRALWVSTLLFALLHGNLYGLPAYLLAGGISAFVVFALDSLYAGMIFHTVYNASILMINHTVGGAANGEAAAAVPGAASMLLEAGLLLALIGLLMRVLDARRRRMGIEPVPRTRQPLRPREWAMLAAALAVMLGTTALVQYVGGGA